MKLALKKAAPKGIFPKLFYYVTKLRLVTKYPHSGIVMGDKLYHSNLSNGLHEESFSLSNNDWDLIDIPDSDTASEKLLLSRFNENKGVKYDWFSLLAFVLPWGIRDSSRFYCYEWCWFAITGLNSTERITPENLLYLVSCK